MEIVWGLGPEFWAKVSGESLGRKFRAKVLGEFLFLLWVEL